MRSTLELEHVDHRYSRSSAQVLNSFSHTFGPGRTALLGPDGAGKSTLL